MDKRVKKIIEALNLEPLKMEGGFFRETYRSGGCTSILYLITINSFSRLHRLSSVEIYNFLSGDPVTMLNINKDGKVHEVKLGNNFYNGELLQHIVPPGSWQGALMKGEGNFALLGTVVSPGFEYSDYESCAKYKDRLLNSFPDYTELLLKLF